MQHEGARNETRPSMAAVMLRRLQAALSHNVLRVVTSRSVQSFYRDDRVQAAGRWIENNIMVKRRERRARLQTSNQSTSDYLKTHFCSHPFTTLETTHSGLAFVCCPIWLPTPIGKLDADPAAVWTGPTAVKLRESIIDGSYRYCDHLHCTRITNRTLTPRGSPSAQRYLGKPVAEAAGNLPKHVTLSHDKSCNLSCPSCRSQTFVASKANQAKLDGLMETSILPMLRQAETVNITGSGDAFGSNHFRNVIKRLNKTDFPKLRIDLHTNGQLWDERAWRELGLAGRVRNAHISIDAARAETYVILRRGGRFERLLSNLAFVRHLRETGELKRFEISMVVQALNFREMPDFVRLGRDHLADTISFQMIRRRDIFSEEEHRLAFIGDPAHPDHAEFVRVLQSPDLRQPQVEMGNVLEYARQAGSLAALEVAAA